MPYTVATIGFAVVMVMLEVAGASPSLRSVLRWLALSLLAYVGVLVVVHIDWAAALAHTLGPRLPAD